MRRHYERNAAIVVMVAAQGLAECLADTIVAVGRDEILCQRRKRRTSHNRASKMALYGSELLISFNHVGNILNKTDSAG